MSRDIHRTIKNHQAGTQDGGELKQTASVYDRLRRLKSRLRLAIAVLATLGAILFLMATHFLNNGPPQKIQDNRTQVTSALQETNDKPVQGKVGIRHR